MAPTHASRVLAVLSSALALTALTLPLPAAGKEVMPHRGDIPDAFLRGVTHVVCVTFPEGGAAELPLYTRGAGGFHRAGAIPRGQTGPLSQWDDDEGWQEDCYPAFDVQAGDATRYAHVLINLQEAGGREAWLREGSERGPEAPWVTIESLRTLDAFEGRRVEFDALRRPGRPLVVRAAPHDSANEVEAALPNDVILGQRVGDFAEVLSYAPGDSGYRRLGWVRIVDEEGLLLLWPTHFNRHGC
ncbi:hypothetical protein [Myxococcus sp. RHSTA-1-4]|uniref:hypothetical protein n=1 Tax=Myxococcus sp. RHSTA-1-4 TaxID=2874601 RepID=UPI001CC0A104|nr:hypothetical protein [Myxococcus sp. RHSTA-1-4]MBZ4423062.1 hypothetical protein [Myxococcus sp. RHSTA-1-4]